MNAENTATLPTIKGNFENQEKEMDYWVEEIVGEVPKDFQGTFFRNGPGRLKLGGEEYRHWFDGDGMIARTTFIDGKVHFSNKFVRTEKYVAETAAGKMIYRGFGGSPKGSFLKRFGPPANPANTGLMLHGDKFLALNEGGRPYAVDPYSLDTEGEYNYQNSLGKSNVFSAHGKVNPKTGCYYNFGMLFEFGAKGPKPGFELYKISPTGKMVDRARFSIDHMTLIHDFAMTDHYAIFIQSGVTMHANPLDLMFGGSIADTMIYDKNLPNRIIIIDLYTMRLVDRIDIEPLAALHFSNAYEKDGDIHFDMVRTKDTAYGTPGNKLTPLNIFDPEVKFNFGAGHYTRVVVNLRKGTAQLERIDDALEGEFPQWDWTRTGDENRYAVTSAYSKTGPGTYFDAIQKIDRQTGKVEVHEFGAFRFTGEPLMVSKPNAKSEDDFYIMCYVYNGNEDRTEVVLIDSQNFSDEIAVVKLGHHLPQGFHGLFSPKVFLEND